MIAVAALLPPGEYERQRRIRGTPEMAARVERTRLDNIYGWGPRALRPETVRRYRRADVERAHRNLSVAFGPSELGSRPLTVGEAEERTHRVLAEEHGVRRAATSAAEDLSLGLENSRIALAVGVLTLFRVRNLQEARDAGIPLRSFHARLDEFRQWLQGRLAFCSRAQIISVAADVSAWTVQTSVGWVGRALQVFGLRCRLTRPGVTLGGLSFWDLGDPPQGGEEPSLRPIGGWRP